MKYTPTPTNINDNERRICINLSPRILLKDQVVFFESYIIQFLTLSAFHNPSAVYLNIGQIDGGVGKAIGSGM